MSSKRSSTRASLFGIIILGGLLSVACAAPLINVRVTSTSNATALHKHTYVLAPGREGVDPSDPLFKEFAAYVTRALTAKGYASTDDPRTADLAILLSYGIGQPTPPDMHVLIDGQTDPTNGSRWRSVEGVTAAMVKDWETSTSAVPLGTMSAGAVDGARVEAYGTVDRASPISQYGRWAEVLAIDAHEYARARAITEVWKTTITSRGSSDNLRQVFPIMIAGAAPYLGADTKGRVSVDLTPESDQVAAILGQTK